MRQARLYVIGFSLVFLGSAIAVLGSVGSSSTSFGGVVFIGPLPIVFGSGPGSGVLAVTALIIAAVMIVTFFLSVMFSRKSRTEV
jgi:uncharacterized protein (TIGR00304 family)